MPSGPLQREVTGLALEANEVVMRPMDSQDVSAVVGLERQAFATPWNAETFDSLLTRDNVEMMVMERAQVVVGYGVLWCIHDHGELANIAVDESLRGRGLGSRLLDALLAVAVDRGVRNLYLEVRESNERASKLYARRGFQEVGRRRDYYESPKEDARVLMRRLP